MFKRFCAIGALALMVLAGGCGDDDEAPKPAKYPPGVDPALAALQTLKIKFTVDKTTGPVPLTSKFHAEVANADGDLIYRWDFDDGTFTSEQNPTHTFEKPGFYYVTVDARDSKGNANTRTGLVSVWTQAEWATSHRVGGVDPPPVNAGRVARQQRSQYRRTDARREAYVAKARAAAKAQAAAD